MVDLTAYLWHLGSIKKGNRKSEILLRDIEVHLPACSSAGRLG